jgi:hypothetical protein
MYNSSKLVKGIGTKGMTYPTWDGKKILKEYDLWGSMLGRCSQNVQASHPTYIGVTCSENFKSYTFFYEWCHKQMGFGSRDEKGRYWHLDKDLLIKGNKFYSEDTCVFVPLAINCLLTKRESKRGSHPLGVHFETSKNKFTVNCNNGVGKLEWLGYFNCQNEAFLAYKTYKEVLIKQIAEQYKHQLDPRAYEALVKYTVEITD